MGRFLEIINFLFVRNFYKFCFLVFLSYWRLEKINEKMFMKEWEVVFELDLRFDA